MMAKSDKIGYGLVYFVGNVVARKTFLFGLIIVSQVRISKPEMESQAQNKFNFKIISLAFRKIRHGKMTFQPLIEEIMSKKKPPLRSITVLVAEETYQHIKAAAKHEEKENPCFNCAQSAAAAMKFGSKIMAKDSPNTRFLVNINAGERYGTGRR